MFDFSKKYYFFDKKNEHFFITSTGGTRKRGDSKKCRKVYGIEHKDQWCKACIWKKACQRFPD